MTRRPAIAAQRRGVLRSRGTAGAALRWDVVLYGGGAVAAAGLGAFTGLSNHRAWAQIAMVGYAAAALVAFGQLIAVRRGETWAGGIVARGAVAATTWVVTAIAPMLMLAGRGLAQAEVRVVEAAGVRWLDTGSPYLGREAIAALPADDRLAAYTPYQPAMAVFGVPRALDPGGEWWSDARIWFAVATVAVLAGAVWLLRHATGRARLLAWQGAAVAPTAALAAAVGGDDLPVLALCVLGLAFVVRGRLGAAGVAVGAAAALKLIAWPVAVVLGVYAATRGREALARYGVGAVAVPLVTLLPAVLADPAAVVENTVRFPLGAGLVASPAEAPFPGYLIASMVPGGGAIAVGLLVAAGIAIAGWLAYRPIRTAAAAAAVSGAGLLVAIALMPATRFGYLLYPLALLAWVPALAVTRRETRTHAAVPGGHERLPATTGRH